MIDAIEMLSEDHNRAKRLFKTNPMMGAQEPALEESLILCQVLTVHTALEEELVYPVIAKEDQAMADRAFEEHARAKAIIAEIEGMDGVDVGALKAAVERLRQEVQAHVDWEEDLLFAKLSALGVDEGEEIGRAMYGRRQELMAEHPLSNKVSPDMPSLDARPKL